MNMFDNNKDYCDYLICVNSIINNDINLDYWGYIPIPHYDICILYPLYERFNCKTIIDLGCGAGNILRYAKNIGYETTGVDFDDFSLYNKDHIFIQKDIRDLDIITYKQYDVIYIALPLKVGNGFEEYIQIVLDNMLIGQYIITPLYIIEDSRFDRIDQYTFVKEKQ